MQPPLYLRAIQELRDYGTSLKSFKPNARLYLAASMLMAVSMAIQNVLYNLYLIQLGYDEDFVGQAAAAVSLGIALGGIPAGLLYDRLGGKVTFRLATVGIVISMVMRVLFEALRRWGHSPQPLGQAETEEFLNAVYEGLMREHRGRPAHGAAVQPRFAPHGLVASQPVVQEATVVRHERVGIIGSGINPRVEPGQESVPVR